MGHSLRTTVANTVITWSERNGLGHDGAVARMGYEGNWGQMGASAGGSDMGAWAGGSGTVGARTGGTGNGGNLSSTRASLDDYRRPMDARAQRAPGGLGIRLEQPVP